MVGWLVGWMTLQDELHLQRHHPVFQQLVMALAVVVRALVRGSVAPVVIATLAAAVGPAQTV